MGKLADEGVSLPEVCERLAQLLDGQARIERQARDAEAGSSERLGRLEQDVGALRRCESAQGMAICRRLAHA